jgi:hypothetical protein
LEIARTNDKSTLIWFNSNNIIYDLKSIHHYENGSFLPSIALHD